MIVAGVGCRAGCAAADVVAAVRVAEAAGGCRVEGLAAPWFKRGEAGVVEAAAALGVGVVFVEEAALLAVQDRCRTRSDVALRAVGVASVAEGAALAASGGRLLVERVVVGGATCAVAG